jgi:glycogen debranching enzyme
VVRVCEDDLWTPMGMRSLGPDDSAYCRHYRGDLAARDRCYHQGTVWPWLLGPFVTAWCRSRPPSEAASARRFLRGLEEHLGAAGLGGISEVADGDEPHTPGGCPWQAWSVAEPLRALCEDVFKTHPPPPREVTIPRRAVAHHP